MCFFKKKNNIKFFVVTPNNALEEFSHIKDPVFLTITSSKKECEEYINKRIYLQKKFHYEQWCSLHNKDLKSMDTWTEYMNLFPEELNKYLIVEVGYSTSSIATIFRMFNGCVPIGTSYDDPAEGVLFLNKLMEQKEVDQDECN